MDQPMRKLALGLLLSLGGLPAALAQTVTNGYGNFAPNFGATQIINATTTSSSVTFSTTTDLRNSELMIYNAGTGLAFCRWGQGAQTAVTTDVPIPSGTVQIFTKFRSETGGVGTNQAVACITGVGTATVYAVTGFGR
jgi:hypothetical protein